MHINTVRKSVGILLAILFVGALEAPEINWYFLAFLLTMTLIIVSKNLAFLVFFGPFIVVDRFVTFLTGGREVVVKWDTTCEVDGHADEGRHCGVR